jgi:hypothetical protein
MPDEKESQEDGEVLDLDPHGKKFVEGDHAGFIRLHGCPKEKSPGHDHQVIELEEFEKKLSA